MSKEKKHVYMVSYIDDRKQKHITFVKGFSEVKFLEDRFEKVNFTSTSKPFFEDYLYN